VPQNLACSIRGRFDVLGDLAWAGSIPKFQLPMHLLSEDCVPWPALDVEAESPDGTLRTCSSLEPRGALLVPCPAVVTPPKLCSLAQKPPQPLATSRLIAASCESVMAVQGRRVALKEGRVG